MSLTLRVIIALIITGFLDMYLINKKVNIRFIEVITTLYLLWVFVVILPKSGNPVRQDIGCAVQVGGFFITVIVAACLWLPWFWILYMYLVLAYFGAFFVEILDFIGFICDIQGRRK